MLEQVIMMQNYKGINAKPCLHLLVASVHQFLEETASHLVGIHTHG